MSTLAELHAAAQRLLGEYDALATRAAKGDETVTVGELADAYRRLMAAREAARIQVARETWDAWSPPFAPHVDGRWTRRVLAEDGTTEPQKVEMVCTHCGDKWQATCSTGLVHGHVQKFALLHLHRDVLGVIPRTLPEDEK